MEEEEEVEEEEKEEEEKEEEVAERVEEEERGGVGGGRGKGGGGGGRGMGGKDGRGKGDIGRGRYGRGRYGRGRYGRGRMVVDATDVDAIAAGARVGTDTPTTTTNMPIHITGTLTTRTVRPMNTHISTDSDTGQGFHIHASFTTYAPGLYLLLVLIYGLRLCNSRTLSKYLRYMYYVIF